MNAIDAHWMRQAALDALHAPVWSDFAHNFAESFSGRVDDGTLGNDGFTLTGPEWTAALKSTLMLAETYYVAPQMHALVAAASESWPEDEVVVVEDFPTDQGWLWLPGAGLVTIDVRGRALHVNAITWDRRGSTVACTWWCHKRYDPVYLRTEGWDLLPDLTPWHVMDLTLGKPVPVAMRMGTLLPPEVSEQIRYTKTKHGWTMTHPLGWTDEQLQPKWATDMVAAWLVSALRIMQTTIVSIEKQGLPAAVRRKWARRPHKFRATLVTVIDLRRVERGEGLHPGREYSHRWYRRGHWRRQPYKHEDGTWDRRRIYIHPTICGPSDKPLLLRHHVQALTR